MTPNIKLGAKLDGIAYDHGGIADGASHVVNMGKSHVKPRQKA